METGLLQDKRPGEQGRRLASPLDAIHLAVLTWPQSGNCGGFEAGHPEREILPRLYVEGYF